MEALSLEYLINEKLLNSIEEIEKYRDLYVNGPYDVENLHQIRVNIRKIRAVCSLLEEYFINDKAKECKNSFGLIAKYTNEARDLDVYLEKLQEYKTILSKKRNNLQTLENYLKEQKSIEHTKLTEFFKSERCVYVILKYQSQIKSNELLKENKMHPNGIVKENLSKIYDSIIKKGSKLNPQSDNRKFHKVRIEFKKLRYFIELLKPVYEKKVYEGLIKELKNIQDLLGDFNDFEVQQKKLSYFIDELDLDENEVSTLSFLIEHFEEHQERLKNKFHKKFKQFSCQKFEKELFDF